MEKILGEAGDGERGKEKPRERQREREHELNPAAIKGAILCQGIC